MMRLAAVDTSTRCGSVALLEENPGACVRVVREVLTEVTGPHAPQILGLLERLLDEAGWARTSLDAFAAARGPGSFTGIRVGLGTVRGLALAAARPALGIGTLDAMAEAVGGCPCERVPILAAGRGEVFGARFDARSHPPWELLKPWVGPVERALNPQRLHATIFGSGAVEFLDRLRAAGFQGQLVSAGLSVAAAAGKIALTQLALDAQDGDGLAPLYIRPPDVDLRPDDSGAV